MGVLGRRSRVSDTADVAAARLKRGTHDVLDSVADAAGDLGNQVAAQVGAQITAARRDLADRIDPDPVPRRGLRLLSLGLLLTTVSAVVWAVLARRPVVVAPHGHTEHVPAASVDDDDTSRTPARTGDPADDEPVPGVTGDPESRSR